VTARTMLALLLLPGAFALEDSPTVKCSQGTDLCSSPAVTCSQSVGSRYSGLCSSTGSGTSSLVNGLVAYWKLDELSGTRAKTAGSCATCDLTAVNAPGAMGGAGSYALATTASAYVSHPDGNEFDATDDMALCAWVRPTGVSGVQRIVDKSGSARDYLLYSIGTSVGFNTSAAGADDVTVAGALTAGVRALICGVHSASSHKAGISVNGTAPTLSAGTFTSAGSDGAFAIGTSVLNGNPYAGAVGPVMRWTRSLDSAALSGLYNSGQGYSCSALPAAFRTNLVACWDLNESSGTRAESGVGSCGTPCNLSAVNSPSRIVGLVQNGLGMSADFDYPTASRRLELASNADIQLGGNTAWEVCAWDYMVNASSQIVFAKWRGSATPADCDYAVWNDTGTRYSGTASDGVSASNTYVTVNATPGAWHLVCSRYSGGTHLWSISSDAVDGSTNAPLTGNISNWPFTIGDLNPPGAPARGPKDAVGIWKGRTLTSSERTALFNAGAGTEYPWSSVVDLWFRPHQEWADIPIEKRQRMIFARTGVFVSEQFFPSFARSPRHAVAAH
jgi:hypothetical protein